MPLFYLTVMQAMSLSPIVEHRIAEAMTRAIDAFSAEKALAIKDGIATLLDRHRDQVPKYCNRYVLGHADEWELGTALSVLGRLKNYDSAIVDCCRQVIRSKTIEVNFKKPALRVIGVHVASLKPIVVQDLMGELSLNLAISFSGSILSNLSKVDGTSQFDLLQTVLSIGKMTDLKERRIYCGTVTVAADTNEKLYAASIDRVAEPYSKTLLMLGLYDLDRKKYSAMKDKAKVVAAGDRLSMWYFNTFFEINP